MPDYPIYRGFGLRGTFERLAKRTLDEVGKSGARRKIEAMSVQAGEQLADAGLDTEEGIRSLARHVAIVALSQLAEDDIDVTACVYFEPLAGAIYRLIQYEELFALPEVATEGLAARSAIWEAEDAILKLAARLDQMEEVAGLLAEMVTALIEPLVSVVPSLLTPAPTDDTDIVFDTPLLDNVAELPAAVENMVQLAFAPDWAELGLTEALKARLEYNLLAASGAVPGEASIRDRSVKLPSRAPAMPPAQLLSTYLGGTPLPAFFEVSVPIAIPLETRFEHHHIVAGSGHGKTQALQTLILHDLDAVAKGEATIVVIDSQADLINTIAGMQVFAPGGPLHDRICLIDPTDVEYPVALNLFDVGQSRLGAYSPLDRERLTNSILELYDFVLGSLLDAGMTQKQTIIFRYITRLLLHIPGATIHTLRELLEDDGYDRYQQYIAKLTGSARAFFDNEFRGKEFAQTRRQVLRRLYGILENQTFERMFSHPKNKLDLFTEMNAGKVILVNTAKDLLKENGTEIFGRFFIAMIAQAAQERAILPKAKRLPTLVYVDEASDYFDRNIGIILSQARKNRVGMILSHQYLGQLEPKLHEAISANTAIKFAGGVSSKDARALAGDLRTDAGMIENQDRLSFAAFINGVTKQAVSVRIEAGRMERAPRMDSDERRELRDLMREKYAVHHSEVGTADDADSEETDTSDGTDDPDTGEPMPWE
ncbi:MAG: ATP-binding protein [Rhizobiaceae bacterium]|nr:ATP-binding protein [Rhizobiaceae bacterium]